MKHGRVSLALGSLLAFAACGPTVAPEVPSGPQPVARPGRFFLCIIDVSASMRENDANRYAEQGTQLAVALLSEGTDFAAVSFSSSARVESDWKKVTAESRAAVSERLSGLRRGGGTNFAAALRAARKLLEKRPSNSTGAVVFLTDGRHSAGGRSETVRQEIAYFEDRECPIYTIGLSDKAESALLREMASRTGGAHFAVAEARQLIWAFVDILSMTEGYLVKRGLFSPVNVRPGTSRIAYLIAKGDSKARISRVLLNGDEPKSTSLFRYPVKSDGRTSVEVLNFREPEGGVWNAETEGGVADWVTLLGPPFDLELVADRPRSEYVAGQTVNLALLARAESEEVLADLRKSGSVSAEVKSEDTGSVVDSADMPCGPATKGEDHILYAGEVLADLSTEGKEETFTTTITCALRWGKGDSWTVKRIVSYLVVPPTGLLVVQPQKLDFGTVWADLPPVRRSLMVLGRQSGSEAALESKSSELSFDPERLPLAVGKEFEVSVSFAPTLDTSPGDWSGKIRTSLHLADFQGDAPEVFVDASARVLRLHGGNVELTGCQPESRIEHLLLHRIEPPVPISWEVGTVTLHGTSDAEPFGFDLSVTKTPGGSSLTATVPADTPVGEYRGDLTLRVPRPETTGRPSIDADTGLTRTLRVTIVVGEPKPRLFAVSGDLRAISGGFPFTLRLKATRKGWLEGGLTISSRWCGSGQLSVVPADMKGPGEALLSSRFCQRIVPEDDWDGKKLVDGVERKITYRIYVDGDLVDGDYEGELVLSLRKEGERPAPVVLPVILSVKIDRESK